MVVTQSDDPPPCQFRRRLQRIVDLRDTQFSSISDLGLQAGLAKGTLTNRLLAAEKAGEEPIFEVPTLTKVAGIGRVSLSWLMGNAKDEAGPDIPPPPKVSPEEIARRKAGGANSEMARLRAAVKRQEDEIKKLRRLLKQSE